MKKLIFMTILYAFIILVGCDKQITNNPDQQYSQTPTDKRELISESPSNQNQDSSGDKNSETKWLSFSFENFKKERQFVKEHHKDEIRDIEDGKMGNDKVVNIGIASEDINNDGVREVIAILSNRYYSSSQANAALGVYIINNEKVERYIPLTGIFVDTSNIEKQSEIGIVYSKIRDWADFVINGKRLVWDGTGYVNESKNQKDNVEKSFVPIIYPMNTCAALVGGIQDNKWISADLFEQLSGNSETDKREFCQRIVGGEKYKFYSIDKEIGEFEGQKVVEENGPGEWFSVGYTPTLENGLEAIGICGDWNALPRIPTIQKENTEQYESAVNDVLTDRGLGSVPAVIKQAISVDLDGNGTEEVLINATNIDYSKNKFAEENTYSFIILQENVGGKDKSFVITENYYKETNENEPVLYNTVPFIVDANGDGKMEVVTKSEYYEGFSLNFYEMNNGEALHVITFGLGA